MCKRCVSISDNDKTVYVIVFSYLDNYTNIMVSDFKGGSARGCYICGCVFICAQ